MNIKIHNEIIERNIKIMRMNSRSKTAIGKIRRFIFKFKKELSESLKSYNHRRIKRSNLLNLKFKIKEINNKHIYKLKP